MSRCFSGVILLAWASTSSAQARPAAEWRDSALRLTRELRALTDSMLKGDSTVQEVTRDDRLVIGATAGLRREAFSAFARIQGLRRRWFSDALPSPPGFHIALTSVDQVPAGSLGRGARQSMVLSSLPEVDASEGWTRVVPRDRFVETVVDLYAELMWVSAGPHLRRWLDPAPPLSMPESERRYIAMYAFVTGSSRAQRSCAAGDLADCAYALGLRAPAVADAGAQFAAFLRTDLLLTALEAGGPGAWGRFRDHVGLELEPALAAAANMPLDSLLSRWRGDLLALRPVTSPIELRGALLAVLWGAALGLGALGISRWA